MSLAAAASVASLPRSAAMRVMTAAARRFIGVQAHDEALDLGPGAIDGPRLLDAAEREGMTGLVALELERRASSGGRALPLEPWRAARRRVAVSNMAALAELAALRGWLRGRGRQVVVLKGAALIPAAYHGRLDLRPLGDVDLLVRPEEMADVVDWLTGRGYRPFAPSSRFLSRGPVAFDLHTEIAGASWVSRKARAFRLDPAALWRDAGRLDPDDPSALVLGPNHQRLHLIVHALKHSYSRLVWLVDIALSLRDAEDGRLLAEARAAGAERALGYALGVLGAVLGLGPARPLADALPPLGRVERAFVRLVARRTGTEVPGELIAALGVPGTMGKLAYLAEVGFPAGAVLARHYPSTPRWLLYPRRAVRLTALGLREGRRLVRSGPG